MDPENRKYQESKALEKQTPEAFISRHKSTSDNEAFESESKISMISVKSMSVAFFSLEEGFLLIDMK